MRMHGFKMCGLNENNTLILCLCIPKIGTHLIC